MKQNVYDFIKQEETAYQTLPVSVIDGYEWRMSDHIQKTVLYKNSQYSTGKNDEKPFKNIMLPLLRLQYRSEGFDVKDIELYVDSPKDYYKSFLIRKFHEKWARDNGIDTFIDDMVECYVDFGGVLVKDVNDVRPEVVPMQRLAFCDQTDILSGPICEKHNYSPDQLLDMADQGWGDESKGASATLEDVIALAEASKSVPMGGGQKKTQTPGKYIEVYELHGMFPVWWLKSYADGQEPTESDRKYSRQLHIIAFYKDQNARKQGVTLFRGKEKESIYKLKKRDAIYGRALGMGGAEELFEPQVWVNYDVIRIKGMLDAASKVIYQTTDQTYKSKNKTSDLDNGDILITEPNTSLVQVNTSPVNMPAFENSTAEWTASAQQLSAATDALLGESPAAGTPFKLQDLITQQGQGIHDYRKGQLATFLDEVYRDWILPYITREITKGQEFLADLDMDELQAIADSLITCKANKVIKEKILSGQVIYPDMIEEFKTRLREDFMKGGNRKFMEIFKDEMKDAPIVVKTNIAGKQKDLNKLTDKVVNVFRQIIANPAVLQIPGMAKTFNEILEYSGLSPIDFAGMTKQQIAQAQPQPAQVQASPQQVQPQPAY